MSPANAEIAKCVLIILKVRRAELHRWSHEAWSFPYDTLSSRIPVGYDIATEAGRGQKDDKRVCAPNMAPWSKNSFVH